MSNKPLPPVSYLRELLIYDCKSGLLTRRGGRNAGSIAGHLDHQGYRIVKIGLQNFRAARVIWKLQTGHDPLALTVDHRNGNRSDDSWSNLRLATRLQQTHNSGGWGGRSLPKGVMQSGRRYIARTTFGGVWRNLGSFSTVEDAHAAYLAFAARSHGDFYRGAE